MATAPSVGSQSRLSFAAAGTAVGSYAEIYEFVNESLKKKAKIHDTQGISGTRTHNANRIADAEYTVSGQISLQPGPYMLGNSAAQSGYASSSNSLLTRIMGSAPSVNVWSMTESLTAFDILIDRIAKRFVYGNCLINTATFSAKAGGPLSLALDIIGQTETLSATAFPALAQSTDLVYMWAQAGTCTLNSVASAATEWSLKIDNKVLTRFSAGSLSATTIYASDQILTMTAVVPYNSDYLTLYGLNSGNTPAASIVFTSGGSSLTFTAGAWAVPDDSPTVQNKGELMLHLSGELKKTGSTPALTITNVGV